MTTDYIAALAALTDEEQRLSALDFRSNQEIERLLLIPIERARIWEARRRGMAIADVPLGYGVERPIGGAAHAGRRPTTFAGARLPIASAAELQRELAAYQQEQRHAAD